MRRVRFGWQLVLALAALVAAGPSALAHPRDEATVEQLKTRLSSASPGEKPHLCVQIAERQLDEADKLYGAGEEQKAQQLLNDVEGFAELARDYAIQSRKYQKQSEIAVRGMTRKLADMLRTLPKDQQAPVEEVITRLERVRDDLLAAMFHKGAP